MAHYRLYFMHSARGQITGFHEFESPDDASAMAAAQRLRRAAAMELWCRDRRIGRWDVAPS